MGGHRRSARCKSTTGAGGMQRGWRPLPYVALGCMQPTCLEKPRATAAMPTAYSSSRPPSVTNAGSSPNVTCQDAQGRRRQGLLGGSRGARSVAHGPRQAHGAARLLQQRLPAGTGRGWMWGWGLASAHRAAKRPRAPTIMYENAPPDTGNSTASSAKHAAVRMVASPLNR